ncbi:MFS transporter [Saccharopolyspora montiporae]|uniref:MFS transporter n=1 Tax=Saccharopolyspora montiporae TaxID=2781240 RepID=UPI00351C1BBF
MPAHTASTAPTNPRRGKEIRRVVLSSYLGSTIEFYDFLLYATAASLVFGPVFFTGLDPLAATIASYGTFAAGYLARPLGGLVLGHFGDRIGRKRMLVLSMTIMGVASFLIGLVPPASAIGSWGAIILVGLRICQGIAVGGEWGGAALMSLEHADRKQRGFAASFTNAGAPSGAVLGTLLMSAFATLPREQFLAWGWRIPFLLSAALLVLGLFVRSRVAESPIFQEAMRSSPPRRRAPVLDVLRRPRTLLLNMLGCSGSFAIQILFATFAITYASAAGADEQLVLLSFAIASFLQIGTVLAFGKLSDVVGRRPVMLGGLALFALLLHPLFGWLGSGNGTLVFLAFLVGLTCHAMTYGPMAAYISEQVGTTSRYTGASLGYQGATLLGAGLTPVVLASLHAAHRTPTPLVWFMVTVCALSAAAVLATRESKDNDLQAL